ncbi:MAG: HIT family protein [Candidatus Campbellbacteria bacterium]|nr:HIT family protein [Candidatus Campbellbacteria bacterium]
MEKTIFQKIIDKELPASIVYEDNSTIAFLDINPNNKGHTLVIPKTPYKNIYELKKEDCGSFMETISKMSRAVKKAVDADGVNVVINNDESAGQVVFHLHAHIIPRFKNDGVFNPSKHTKYADEKEQEEITEKIKNSVE